MKYFDFSFGARDEVFRLAFRIFDKKSKNQNILMKKTQFIEKTKKTKKPRVSGKGFGGYFCQSPWCFFGFLIF